MFESIFFRRKPLPKLYYTSSSCGAASFIAAYTAGVNLETEQVDLRTHKTVSGRNYYEINPKGNVPALVLEDGTLLNEGAAVLQYIADLAPGKIAPSNGTTQRYLVQNLLNFISSELHPNIGALFYPGLAPDVQILLRERVDNKLSYLEDTLLKDHKKESQFLIGNTFTIADSYLYIVLSWTTYVNISLDKFPKALKYYNRLKNLTTIQDALKRIALNPSTIFPPATLLD